MLAKCLLPAWIALLSLSATERAATSDRCRPPAVPLVTSDPYFSIWSFADHLTDDTTRHWTGTPQSMTSMVVIDRKPYRLMGGDPANVAAMTQSSVEVLPTRTLYTFEAGGVRVILTFMTPLLPADLDLLSRPATYIEWEVRSMDSKEHRVAVYYDASAALAVNTLDEPVVWSRDGGSDWKGAPPALHVGTQAQPVLAKKGDNLRIDWGYLYVSAGKSGQMTFADPGAARDAFAQGKTLPGTEASGGPAAAKDAPAMAVEFPASSVRDRPVTHTLVLAYDDIYSIDYFQHRLRAWWRRNGATAADLIAAAWRDRERLTAECRRFDEALMADLTRQGGGKYARIAALSYRQSFAAQKLVSSPEGKPYLLPKENFSNGCIGTVDVIYPTAPILLLLNPALERASLAPVLDYAASRHWHFPFAPHDLGTYPLAEGQVYGGKETSEKDQMPVEESGNFLVLVAALAKVEGNAAFAEEYWRLLEKWAEYLKSAGLDPANQLCTDDFAGHLAHNANLSLKAIEALGSYAMLAGLAGHKDEASAYRQTAAEFASRWETMAADSDHYKLAFDRPGTWSQDYNLVWDRLLGLNLFPAEVARKDIAFYRTKLNRFGLPLDNRRDYTKLDWEIWTATLADSASDFEALIGPIYDWVNQTPKRVPLTDWYSTTTGKQQGFQARSVVGGIYIKMLADPGLWKKWSTEGARSGSGKDKPAAE
ncbi:MAG TPA: DUF4965 domain-containing protein [Terriglobia bacterium]|nr:DUF4965 domain-containing protein [Terriglobia bacterium]